MATIEPEHFVQCRDEKCFHRGTMHSVWRAADPVYELVIVHMDRCGSSWNQMVGKKVGEPPVTTPALRCLAVFDVSDLDEEERRFVEQTTPHHQDCTCAVTGREILTPDDNRQR